MVGRVRRATITVTSSIPSPYYYSLPKLTCIKFGANHPARALPRDIPIRRGLESRLLYEIQWTRIGVSDLMLFGPCISPKPIAAKIPDN